MQDIMNILNFGPVSVGLDSNLILLWKRSMQVFFMQLPIRSSALASLAPTLVGQLVTD